MVFSSIPTYLDAPNWQQHPNDQGRVSGSSDGLVPLSQDVPPVRPPPPQPQPHAGGYVSGPIRPGSMAEKARLGNIPMLEAPLKCPRCESTNTKFCYFNNYCLSQPRHFCKTCKRYWTRGGATRSVPVGGGCRRNKLSKACTNSKSPACSSDRQTTSSSTSAVFSNSVRPGNLFGLINPPFPAFRFLSPLGQFTDHYNSGAISLSYSTGLSSTMMGSCEPNFQTNFFNEIDGVGGGSSEQWRLNHLHQFPLLGCGSGFDLSPAGFHHFQGTIEPSSPNVRAEVSASILTEMASIKMEENQGLNLSRQLMGFSGNDPWTGAAWNDFATFCSSSTNKPY